ERARAGANGPDIAELADAVFGELAGTGLAFDHGQLIASLRCAIEAQHFHRRRRSGGHGILALVIDERTNAAPGAARHDELANPQRAALNENRADRPAPAFELRLNDDAFRRPVGIGCKLKYLGL